MKYFLIKTFFIVFIYPIIEGEEIKINDEIQSGTLIEDLTSKSVFTQDRQDGKVTFQLLSVGSFVDYLYIGVNNGKLFAKRKIDRDSLCGEIDLCCKNDKLCSITISVAMMMGKIDSDPIVRQIIIVIDDKNDHQPTFIPPKFNLSISESCPVTTVFQLPLAIDKDSDINSVKTYKLLSKNDDSIFGIETQLVDNKMTAYLRLKHRLDREDLDQYSVTIIAIDGGTPSLTGTLEALIIVTDINDNAPVFENTRYSVTVNESQMANEHIIQLLATDKDIGENAEIYYRLDSGTSSVGSSDMFRVDLRSGAIYMVSALDYEKQQNYKLIVTASNRIPGVGTATATLTVNVLNLNDEKPVIFVDYLNSRQHALIMEHAVAPKFVSIISVSDKDTGNSGKTNCRLENENELFDLRLSGLDQYKIHTRQPLDRETTARYSLSVICNDLGNPSLSATVIVPVIIMDENDNKPEIHSLSLFHIAENKPVGTVVTRIDATDKDDGLNGKLTYSITDTENRILSYLSIDPQRGILKTTQIIDREATNPPLIKLDLIVTVSDSGVPKQSTVKAIQIIIDDENDNAPQFVQTTIRFSISENESPTYRLGQIEVSDPDETDKIRLVISNSKLNYRKCPFSLTLENNGYWLMTTESLNWEIQSSHELIIIATDGPGYKAHTTSATIQVTVLDVNDNPPVFIFPRPGNGTTHTVSYRQQSGFILLTVSATDKDNPAIGNGRFHFSIITDLSNFITIDSTNGKIRINRQMTLSDVRDHYVTIRVEDQGSPPLSSDLKMKIRVTDSPVHFNEKGNEYEGYKPDSTDSSGSIFTDRESIFVFGLILILLIVMLCVCFIVYVRHMKGWLVFLPDLISLCRFKDDSNPPKPENFNSDEGGHLNSPTKYIPNSNYYQQRFMTSPQPNFSRTPEIFIKNGRDCYEVLKCPQDIQHDPCQMPMINEQQYNDLLSTNMLPPFQDSYLTLHQYNNNNNNNNININNEYPLIKDNINNHNFPKYSKTISSPSTTNVIPLGTPDKSHQQSFVLSKASYAVSFPTEQSTFV